MREFLVAYFMAGAYTAGLMTALCPEAKVPGTILISIGSMLAWPVIVGASIWHKM